MSRGQQRQLSSPKSKRTKYSRVVNHVFRGAQMTRKPRAKNPLYLALVLLGRRHIRDHVGSGYPQGYLHMDKQARKRKAKPLHISDRRRNVWGGGQQDEHPGGLLGLLYRYLTSQTMSRMLGIVLYTYHVSPSHAATFFLFRPQPLISYSPTPPPPPTHRPSTTTITKQSPGIPQPLSLTKHVHTQETAQAPLRPLDPHPGGGEAKKAEASGLFLARTCQSRGVRSPAVQGQQALPRLQ